MDKKWQGKVCLITGATSGIGRETAVKLAELGLSVVFSSRNKDSGESTVRYIKERTGCVADYFICDLASFSEIRNFADLFIGKYDRLDLLINNAGVGETSLKFSKDNIEMDMAVNYFAPFLLTNLLLPLIRKSAPSRIINISSMMHAEGHIDFENLTEGKNFNKYSTYAQSKLALILFTKKLAGELRGSGVTVNAMHPGVINTKITKDFLADTNPLVRTAFGLTMISEEKSAEGISYVAISPEIEGVTGEYFDRTKMRRSSDESYDMEIADRIWDISKKICNLQN